MTTGCNAVSKGNKFFGKKDMRIQDGRLLASSFVSGFSFIATDIGAAFEEDGKSVILAIYNDSDGTPDALIGQSSEFRIPSETLVTRPLERPVFIPAKETCWLAILGIDDDERAEISATQENRGFVRRDNVEPPLPSPFKPTRTGNRRLHIYLDGCSSGISGEFGDDEASRLGATQGAEAESSGFFIAAIVVSSIAVLAAVGAACI